MTKNTFDLDFDPMTLILKLDLDMVKMYLYTEDEVPSYSSSKVIAWTDTQTHRHTDRQTDLSEIITYPHADGKNSHRCEGEHESVDDYVQNVSMNLVSHWHLSKAAVIRQSEESITHNQSLYEIFRNCNWIRWIQWIWNLVISL